MFEAEEFQLKAPVDKRGRKVRREKRDEGLRRFYRQEEEVFAHTMHMSDNYRFTGSCGLNTLSNLSFARLFLVF